MAHTAVITIDQSTPTLLYSGDGQVMFFIVDPNRAGDLLVGGSDVSQSNGANFTLLSSAKVMPLRVGSDDELYGLMKTTGGASTMDVLVFSSR